MSRRNLGWTPDMIVCRSCFRLGLRDPAPECSTCIGRIVVFRSRHARRGVRS